MSVDNNSSIESTDPSIGDGSITMDRLQQFVDEDVWYFSDEEDDTSSSCSSVADTDPRVSPSPPDDDQSILPTEVSET